MNHPLLPPVTFATFDVEMSPSSMMLLPEVTLFAIINAPVIDVPVIDADAIERERDNRARVWLASLPAIQR